MKPFLTISLAAVLAGAIASYGPGRQIASLANPAVRESSGIAASWLSPGLFWTHNDSGDRAFIYLFDRSGRDLGAWTVSGARNRDWEDMAIGPGPVKGRPYLYIGDIGDNGQSQEKVIVYRVPEPDPAVSARETAPAEALVLHYPGGPRDAEALAVHPRTGDLYIVTKGRGEAGTEVFRAPAPHAARRPIELQKVGTVRLPPEFDLSVVTGRVTGAAISPNGRSVVLCDYLRAYEADVPLGQPFDRVWSAVFRVLDPGPRKQGEAVTYSRDGKAILLTSEGSPGALFEIPRKLR